MRKIILCMAVLLAMSTANWVHSECIDGLLITKPDIRYKDHQNGTVTDMTTGLIWQKCSLGQSWDSAANNCSGNAIAYSWPSALAEAEKNNLISQSDWRLPNIKELESLIERACHNPSINSNIFPDSVANLYWSSTPHIYLTNYAKFMNFIDGRSAYQDKTNTFYVRLIRKD